MTADDRRLEALKVVCTHIPVTLPPDRGDIRATLAQVCKDWYQLIRDNPQLWASISVRSGAEGVDTRLQRLVDENAPQQPLSLFVEIGREPPGFNVITRLVEPYADRLRALHIEVNDRTSFLQLMTIKGSFPILEEMVIRAKRPFIPALQDIDYDQTASLNATSFTEFTLDYHQSRGGQWNRLDPARFLFPWTQLTKLFFPNLAMSLYSFYMIIRQTSSLVSTEFKILLGQQVDPSPNQPFQMAKLIKARFTFVGDQSLNDAQVLAMVTFSALRTLHLRIPLHTLASFPDLKTQASNLKTVTISNTETGTPKVFPALVDHTGFLDTLPRTLVHLECLHSPLPSDTLASLASGLLFPNLTHLSVLEVQAPDRVITTMAPRFSFSPLVYERSSHGGDLEEVAHVDEAGDGRLGAITHARDATQLSRLEGDIPVTSPPSTTSAPRAATSSTQGTVGVAQAAGVSALRALVLVTTHELAGSVSSAVEELNLPRADDTRLAPVIRVVH